MVSPPPNCECGSLNGTVGPCGGNTQHCPRERPCACGSEAGLAEPPGGKDPAKGVADFSLALHPSPHGAVPQTQVAVE